MILLISPAWLFRHSSLSEQSSHVICSFMDKSSVCKTKDHGVTKENITEKGKSFPFVTFPKNMSNDLNTG